MKLKSFLFLSLIASATVLYAIPARRGIKKVLTLADGTRVEAELRGDEHGSYWESAEGLCFVQADEDGLSYVSAPREEVVRRGDERRMEVNAYRLQRLNAARKTKVGGDHQPYVGSKKGLVILVNFQDATFQRGHTKTFFDRMMNNQNLSENRTFKALGFIGSVKDYFLAQSNGVFELDFDVVGPYTLANEYAFYGKHDKSNNDAKPGHMIWEAVEMADKDVDFKTYDWDGDGEVEQVYVMYAGLSEAAGGDPNTVWPHEHRLSLSSKGVKYDTADGVSVDTYACGSENAVFGYTQTVRVDGIGTICHEFSHCLGLPDFYDAHQTGCFGMGSWDLMDNGSYNGESLVPPNYCTYSKMYAGWMTPIELTGPTTVRNLQPQGELYGQAFVIYNDANRNEYYLLENRQQKGDIWDSKPASSGLMIQYVDFNRDIWEANNVNSTYSYSERYGERYANMDNDHERCTIFHADNSARMMDEPGDLYPYNGNNSLTDTSSPAAVVRNGRTLMGKPITNIVQNADGTISFDFMGGSDINIIDGMTDLTFRAVESDDVTRVYDLQGHLIYTAPTATFTLWDVPAHGVLIIKQGTQVRKVVR